MAARRFDFWIGMISCRDGGECEGSESVRGSEWGAGPVVAARAALGIVTGPIAASL